VLACRCDVRVPADVERAVDAVTGRFGTVHVLVNNAGGTVRKLFLEMTESEWVAMIDLNLTQAFRWTSLVGKRMIADGVDGTIVNVTTIEAHRAAPGYAPYAAAKAGLESFTKSMALELAPWGIRVNAIAPDATITPGTARVQTAAERAAMHESWAHIPRNRRGRPEDFAGAALFLASDLSAWITGETIHVGGGTLAAAGWRRDEDGFWNNGGPRQAYSGRPLRDSVQDA
jgi:3-oxoacyl-[acyl-carrier protein] reductase